MLRIIKLILPVIFPSWRFFDTVAPSPRVEYRVDSVSSGWQEFCPKAQNRSFLEIVRRLFWNPDRNEALFVTSCAERMIVNPTQHSEDQIIKRILNDIDGDIKTIQYRLVFIYRNDNTGDLEKQMLFESGVRELT